MREPADPIADAAEALSRECRLRLCPQLHLSGYCTHYEGAGGGVLCYCEGDSAPGEELRYTAKQGDLYLALERKEG